VGVVTQEQVSVSVAPSDVAQWLATQGWSQIGRLGDVASRWGNDRYAVVVPLLRASADFDLRWVEMLDGLSEALDTDPEGIVLAVTKAGSDIAEFRAAGDGSIDDSIPLGDAAVFIESVRRLLQASANSTLQPRSYYGHSLPEAARDHARNVRMGQTRRGSYIVPVISRVPILEPDDEEDAILFEDVAYQPFARSAMLRLRQGLTALRDLTSPTSKMSGSQITESVGLGVSSELCDAVASTLETDSVARLDVSFSWAERLPVSRAREADHVELDSAVAARVRRVADILKGETVIGRQTLVGYVKRVERGETDEVGRVTLRVLDNDKARNVWLDLNDAEYHAAGEANIDRRTVSVSGTLLRDPGRALRFTEVDDFHIIEGFDDTPSGLA
jgi:hypothetical protein